MTQKTAELVPLSYLYCKSVKLNNKINLTMGGFFFIIMPRVWYPESSLVSFFSELTSEPTRTVPLSAALRVLSSAFPSVLSSIAAVARRLKLMDPIYGFAVTLIIVTQS